MFASLAGAFALLGALPTAQIGSVDGDQKISETSGGFEGVLDPGDGFGVAIATLGDLDGDGVQDLAVGAFLDDDGGVEQGAVWILFMNAEGTVDSETKISETTGGFAGVLDPFDNFGYSVAALGDLDGDGCEDLAVGAYGDDDGGSDQGAVWILFLNADGTVDSETKISEAIGSFPGGLDPFDGFGRSVAAPGDLDGDGVPDLVVGAPKDDDGGTDQGAVWILFLNANGTVSFKRKISETSGAFNGNLDPADYFGGSVTALGDLDGDGAAELAVGAPFDDDGGTDQGAVWILFLNASGTVASAVKISATSGGFTGDLDPGDTFGTSVAALDYGTFFTGLAVGAPVDDDGGTDQGAVWILFVLSDGTVADQQKISETAGGFGGVLDPFDYFAHSVAALGDLDSDGTPDLAVGATLDDDGGGDRGAVWILFLEGRCTAVQGERKISDTSSGFTGHLDPGDIFGSSVAGLGDLDGDGIQDLAVGAPGGGSVDILFMNADGTVASDTRVTGPGYSFCGENELYGSSVAALGDLDGHGETLELAVGVKGYDFNCFLGYVDGGAVWIESLRADGTSPSDTGIIFPFSSYDYLGSSVSALGDLDDDGIEDLAVGADGDEELFGRESVRILFLNADGTVADQEEIGWLSGGFGGDLGVDDHFGSSVSALGDLNGDGIEDLAVGAYGDDDGGTDQGAVWILFLNTDGTVASETKISATSGGFGGALAPQDFFGSSVAALGDFDHDGTPDLAVGAYGDDDGGNAQGAVWILFLNADGTVASETKISDTTGDFGGVLDPDDHFGSSVAALGDLDHDGTTDLAVGAPGDDNGGSDTGAVWILFLREPDRIPPLLSCPTAMSAFDSKSGTPGEEVFFSVTATDNCDSAPSVTCVPPSGSHFPHGTTIVTCTATDVSGNQSICTFPVVVTSTARERKL